MRYFALSVLLCAVLPACGSKDDLKFSSEETILERSDALDRRRSFEEAVIGHEFRGDGVDVTVLEDGVLVGTHLGRPFIGSWEYDGGEFCASLTSSDIRKAPDRRCFLAAVAGREVTLHPLPPG